MLGHKNGNTEKTLRVGLYDEDIKIINNGLANISEQINTVQEKVLKPMIKVVINISEKVEKLQATVENSLISPQPAETSETPNAEKVNLKLLAEIKKEVKESEDRLKTRFAGAIDKLAVTQGTQTQNKQHQYQKQQPQENLYNIISRFIKTRKTRKVLLKLPDINKTLEVYEVTEKEKRFYVLFTENLNLYVDIKKAWLNVSNEKTLCGIFTRNFNPQSEESKLFWSNGIGVWSLDSQSFVMEIWKTNPEYLIGFILNKKNSSEQTPTDQPKGSVPEISSTETVVINPPVETSTPVIENIQVIPEEVVEMSKNSESADETIIDENADENFEIIINPKQNDDEDDIPISG